MNGLYFVKLRNHEWSDVTFLFTARCPCEAAIMGRECINPIYHDQFKVVRVERICSTPDEVLCYEPV